MDKGIAAVGWLRICFYLLQFTWGLPVNLIGLIVFLCCRKRFPSERFTTALLPICRETVEGCRWESLFSSASIAEKKAADFAPTNMGTRSSAFSSAPCTGSRSLSPALSGIIALQLTEKSTAFHTTPCIVSAGPQPGAKSGAQHK